MSVGNNILNIGYFDCSWQIIGKIKGEKSFKVEGETQPGKYSTYVLIEDS